jgi:hypothetical protein
MSYLAWTDDDDGGRIYWAEMGPFGWGSPRLAADRRSAFGPALGMAGDDYYMAWCGGWYKPEGFNPVRLDTTIWWSGFDRDRGEWKAQQALTDRKTDKSPALSSVGGRPVMAWSDWVDGTPYWSKMRLGEDSWGGPGIVGIAGVLDVAPPALATRATVYLAWATGRPGIGWTSLNPVQDSWFESKVLRDRGSSHTPQLATGLGDPLVMAWKGLGEDTTIYWSAFDGSDWGPQQPLPDRQTRVAPALGTVGGTIVMAWSWQGDVYSSLFLGGQWNSPRRLEGARSNLTPGLPN